MAMNEKHPETSGYVCLNAAIHFKVHITFSFRDAKVPDPPEGQRWKAIQHDNKVCYEEV